MKYDINYQKTILFIIMVFCGAQTIFGNGLERITTKVPYPRGLAMVDGVLYALCRGRVRGSGGVSAKVDDQAGTIYKVDPTVSEPFTNPTISEAIKNNGEIFALPTNPPFRLWDKTANPPESDRGTDRPYCTLRYHDLTKSFYLCAFSGVDKPLKPYDYSFSKNLSDAILRYDLRSQKWHEIERHNIEAGGNYPHHDPSFYPPPHGWLNGPDNCQVIGKYLYAVAKDNSVLARYDISEHVDDPYAPAPQSEVLFDANIYIKGKGMQRFYGQSAIAYHDGYLYVGYRTSSVILRFAMDKDGEPKLPIEAEIVAKLEPFDPVTGKSANLTDITFDQQGRIYVVSAQPAKVYRFKPNPKKVFDISTVRQEAYLDLAQMTSNPKMKIENIMIDDTDLYVASSDGYDYQNGAFGTIYRTKIN